MARKVVPLVTGNIYHVYNRGVDKRDIFTNKNQYLRFYQSLAYFNQYEPTTNFFDAKDLYKSNKIRPLVKIHAYALLANHFHLIIEQMEDGGISQYLKRIAGGYTAYFNNENNRNGVLFQGKFKRVLVDNDNHYKYLFAYVNENHTVHGLPSATEVYESSSVTLSTGGTNLVLNEIQKGSYDRSKASLLARDIYERREKLKSYLLE